MQPAARAVVDTESSEKALYSTYNMAAISRSSCRPLKGGLKSLGVLTTFVRAPAELRRGHVGREALELGNVLQRQGEVGGEDALDERVPEEFYVFGLPSLSHQRGGRNYGGRTMSRAPPDKTLRAKETAQRITITYLRVQVETL